MNESESLPPAPPPGEEGGTFLVRWRSRTSGPYSRAELDRKLARQEIGLLHEVLCDGSWVPLKTLLGSTGALKSEPSPMPAVGEAVPELAPVDGAGRTEADERYELRWKGAVLGRFSFAEIERKLDRQDISMLHEIALGGQWIALSDFFVQRNRTLARARSFAAPAARVLRPGRKLGARMVLAQITQQLANGARILDEINLVVEPNEFIAILGPSGSGKTTLMDAMTGRRRANSGTLTLNGEGFYANFAKYRQRIGHVPQKDIVHLTLTVEQTMRFAARLRLPAAMPAADLSNRVAEVVQEIGLQECRTIRNSDLSGGQLKRVSLGVELLSNPELLFLDEATSGLDAGTEARMMSLFRRLADAGRSVVCITHNLENVCLCDLAAVLVRGRLAYYGPTADLVSYFGVAKVSQIYDCLETRTPEEWVQLFAGSAHYQTYVRARLNASGEAQPRYLQAPHGLEEKSLASPVGGWGQFLVLTRRYLAVTLQDRRNLFLLLAQAPIIALLLGVVFHGKSFEASAPGPDIRRTLSFLLVVSAIWFGCINAAREIVKELAIYLRERAVGLSLGSYLGSKIAVLALLCAVQCAMLLGLTLGLTRFRPDIAVQATALSLTSCAGMLMGLLVSALVKSEDKAMAIVPILLIPQVIFSGAILELTRVAEGIAKWLIVAFWSFDAMLHGLPHSDSLVPKLHCGFDEDITTIGMFLVVLTVAAALALKRKDSAS